MVTTNTLSFFAFQKLPDSMFTHSILINISRINQIYPLFVCNLQCIHSYLLIKGSPHLEPSCQVPKDTSLALNPVFPKNSIIHTMIFYITTTALTRASFYSKSKGYYQPLQYTIK